jgi:hypothetical protein
MYHMSLNRYNNLLLTPFEEAGGKKVLYVSS